MFVRLELPQTNKDNKMKSIYLDIDSIIMFEYWDNHTELYVKYPHGNKILEFDVNVQVILKQLEKYVNIGATWICLPVPDKEYEKEKEEFMKGEANLFSLKSIMKRINEVERFNRLKPKKKFIIVDPMHVPLITESVDGCAIYVKNCRGTIDIDMNYNDLCKIVDEGKMRRTENENKKRLC